MLDLFQDVYAFTALWEGGIVDNPVDPGGLTNGGITLPDLQRFSRAATRQDLLDLTEPERQAIYLALYFLPVAGWQLPPAIALMVFDHGVNCGIGDSARLLQRLLLVTPDGQIGRDTLAAMRRVPAFNWPHLADELNASQSDDYRSKADARFFIKGWEARLAARLVAARKLKLG